MVHSSQINFRSICNSALRSITTSWPISTLRSQFFREGWIAHITQLLFRRHHQAAEMSCIQMSCFRECLSSTRLSVVVRTALVRLQGCIWRRERIYPLVLFFVCFNWLVSVAFMFFFLISFTLLIPSSRLFVSFLVTSRLAPRWELPWGAPLGHFLLSKTAKLGKGKILLPEAMGKIAGMVCLGCHRFGDNLSCCCRVQVTV